MQKDISGIQNRNGAIFFSLLFFGLASLTTVDSIFSERRAVRAEALGGHYNPALYIIVKGLVDALLLRIIPAILFLLPFYFLMGLNPISGRAAIFFGAIPTFSAAVGWLSLCVCTLASTPGKANLLIIVILLICMLFGGFVSNLKAMPEVMTHHPTTRNKTSIAFVVCSLLLSISPPPLQSINDYSLMMSMASAGSCVQYWHLLHY